MTNTYYRTTSGAVIAARLLVSSFINMVYSAGHHGQSDPGFSGLIIGTVIGAGGCMRLAENIAAAHGLPYRALRPIRIAGHVFVFQMAKTACMRQNEPTWPAASLESGGLMRIPIAALICLPPAIVTANTVSIGYVTVAICRGGRFRRPGSWLERY